MDPSLSDEAWNSYKELKTMVWKYLNQEPDSNLPIMDLENVLRKYKPNFFALLENPPKNPKKRADLEKGLVEAINIRGLGHQVLSKQIYEEAIVLSDMLNIDEFVALDLLCTAETVSPNYPEDTRGCVAVLLYYEGRKALVTTLLYLVQARTGIQWSVCAKPEIVRLVTEYTDQLMEAGLFNNIFHLLRTLDFNKEIEKLQSNLALGSPKHRDQVVKVFTSIRYTLGDIIFSCASQCGLPKDACIELLCYLREVKLELKSSGTIDDVTLLLQLSFLAAIDLSVYNTREDSDELVMSLPIVSDKSFIPGILFEFLTPTVWACAGIHALCGLSIAVCLAYLRILPQSCDYKESMDQEDAIVDSAIEHNVFSFLDEVILENQTVYKEQFLYKTLHNLLTDFIIFMYPKVKELRMKSNEVSRTMLLYAREGLQPPANLPRYFESLLLSIGKFYSKNKFNEEYNLVWWNPMELNSNRNLNTSIPSSNKSVTLFKFIKLAGDNLPSTLFVPFLNMLSGLSNSKETARFCFNMLKQAGVHLPLSISWDHFFQSFGQYYNNLKPEPPAQVDTVYRMRSNYNRSVNPEELEGLQAVLLLLRTVAGQENFLRAAFCEHPNWTPLPLLLGLVRCSIPITLKADLLKTLRILSKSPETAKQMWDNLEASQILVTVPTTSPYTPRGIQTELDEVESKIGEYPLTRAILELLDTLIGFGIPTTLGAGLRRPGFDPYLSFIVNSVFLKYNYRYYKTVSEKWDVARLCLRLFDTILKHYEPQVTDFPRNAMTSDCNSPPGYHLTLQLQNKTETLQIILDIIDAGNAFFEAYVSLPYPGRELVEECTLLCLHILFRTLALQLKFSHVLATTSASIILTGLNKLLLAVNRRSGKPDHCLNIAKYVGYHYYLPNHSVCAVRIIRQITSNINLHCKLILVLTYMKESQNIIKHGFVQCLDAYEQDERNTTKKEILKLLKQCLPYQAPNFTHFLMGFDIEHDVSKTEFQYPGVMGFPRNCLHSILSILDTNISRTSDSVHEELVETAYHLLYLLAANPKTSGPVLSFVRLKTQFFPLHLRNCQKPEDMCPSRLNQISWLLKTLAIELKVTTTLKQVSYLKQLTNYLANMPASDETGDNFFLNQILPLDLKELGGIPPPITENPPSQSPKARKLYAYKLKKNKDALVGARISVIEYADAWRQVVEVLVSFIPLEILGSSDQQVFSITILLNILKKVKGNELLPEVTRYLSGCVLLIMDNIKRHYLEDKKFVNVLSHNLGCLKEILESLMMWIMNSEVSSIVLRINLYAALVAFLEFNNVQRDRKEILSSDSLYISRLDGSQQIIEPKGRLLNLCPKDFDNFGEKLLEVLCLDCIGSQEVCKILAMASFTSLISLTGNFKWIYYFSGRGYLKHIINSILGSDQDLRRHLEPGSENIKAFYLYMGRILLLIRLAGTELGCELIMEHQLFGVLSKMTVYDLHPEISKQWMVEDSTDDQLQSVSEKYLKIFMPALNVCNAILTTLGTENISAVIQVMNFLMSHLDVVEIILRSGNTDLFPPFLKELSLLTSVISRTANNDLCNIMQNPVLVPENKIRLYRIQQLMLNLIPKFVLSEDTIRRLLVIPRDKGNRFQSSDRLLYAMQIASNLLWYARNSIANNDIEHEGVGVLFYPILQDPVTFQNRASGGSNDRDISLGWIMKQLINTVNYQRQGKQMFESIQRKIMEVPDMSLGELREYIGEDMDMFDLHFEKQRVYKILWEGLRKKTKEMEYCAFIIENSLYLLWSHLNHFMVHASPLVRHRYISDTNLEATASTSSELSSNTSEENIINLKQGIISLFNDIFSKQLLETAQGHSVTDQEFLRVLLQKIKTLGHFA